MKTRKLGKIKMNGAIFQVVVTDDSNGGFFTTFEENVIGVGIACTWDECLSTLTHELVECAFSLLHLRFVSCDAANDNLEDMHFAMSHNQYSEAICLIGMPLAKLLPKLKREFKKGFKEPQKEGSK